MFINIYTRFNILLLCVWLPAMYKGKPVRILKSLEGFLFHHFTKCNMNCILSIAILRSFDLETHYTDTVRAFFLNHTSRQRHHLLATYFTDPNITVWPCICMYLIFFFVRLSYIHHVDCHLSILGRQVAMYVSGPIPKGHRRNLELACVELITTNCVRRPIYPDLLSQ